MSRVKAGGLREPRARGPGYHKRKVSFPSTWEAAGSKAEEPWHDWSFFVEPYLDFAINEGATLVRWASAQKYEIKLEDI